MTLEERRQRYHCGSRFIQSQDIPTWQEYSQKLAKKPKQSSRSQLTYSMGVNRGYEYQMNHLRWSAPHAQDEEEESSQEDIGEINIDELNKDAKAKPNRELNQKIALYHGGIIEKTFYCLTNPQ